MPVLGRVTTAMVTPFTTGGDVDLDGAQRLARHLVDHGTDTVLVSGTTGESPTIHGDEVVELQTAVREAVRGRGKVMMGTGTNDTRKTIALTERATEVGADAILVVTPYYNRPSQRELAAHFTAVAQATDLPVVLYDVPGRTSREIGRETIIELSGVENIVAVKDASGDLAKASEVVAGTAGAPGGFEVYSGADELNLPMLAIGAVGFVSVAAHLAGPQIAEMAALFETSPDKARQIHLDLMPLYRALFLEPSPGPLKGAMNRLGLPAGPVRGPLLEAEDASVEAVLAAMRVAGIPTGV